MSNFWGAYQFTRTYGNEYDALTEVSTSYLLRPPSGLNNDK